MGFTPAGNDSGTNPGHNPDAVPDTQGSQGQEVGCSVDLVRREFNDSSTDLTVKVPGGRISVSRVFYENKWHFDPLRNALDIKLNPLDGKPLALMKGIVPYERQVTSSAAFVNGIHVIVQEGTEYRWQDKYGNWMTFHPYGGVKAYGTRTGVIGQILYDPQISRRALGIADRNDRQVIWFEYDEDGSISAAHDAEGRRVEYTYEGDQLTGVKDVLENITSYEYDGNGQLTRKTDAAGHQTIVAYDAYGNVSNVVDSAGAGHSFQFDYNSAKLEYYAQVNSSSGMIKEVWYDAEGDTKQVMVNGRMSSKIVKDGRNLIVTDERGYVTRKAYDEWKNLTRIVYPDGATASYEYEHNFSKPLKKTNERGIFSQYAYDATGNLITEIEAVDTPQRRITHYTYDGDGNLLSRRRAGDGTSAEASLVMSYDAFGNITSLTNPEGELTLLIHDGTGNLTRMTDARGMVWEFGYDAAGRLTSWRDPLGNRTQMTYDPVGNKIGEVDAEGRAKTFTYDEHNRLIRTTDTGGNLTQFEYNTDGKLTRQIDPEGKIIQYLYDSEARLTKKVDGNGNEIRLEYLDYRILYFRPIGGGNDETTYSYAGKADQPVKIIYPTFTKEYRYDSRGRKVQERDVLGETTSHTTRFGYDRSGNLVSWIDKESKNTAYEYDALGRPMRMTDASGNITLASFDNRDNLIALTDANGNKTRFEYDRSNRLLKEIRPMGAETTYGYDAAGSLLRKVDPKGQLTKYTYDSAHRLTEVLFFSNMDHSNPVKTVTLAYDKLGHLMNYQDGETSGEYAYDDAYRRINETLNYGPFELSNLTTWYRNGTKKSFTGPNGITYSYSFDNANQLSSIEIPGQGFVTYNAYAWNKPAAISLPGGVTREYAYDPMMRIQSIKGKDPVQSIMLNYTYTYDKMDNVLGKATEHGSYSFNYDNLYQIINADNPTSGDESYTYDPVGNRLTAEGIDETWAYNHNDELLQHGVLRYTYDANGNTIQKKTSDSDVINYLYDTSNRLVRVEAGTGVKIAEYGYDPFGRRLWKDVGGTRSYFLYADEGLVGEYEANGSEITTYGYIPGSNWTTDPLFVKRGEAYYFFHNDHLGRPQKITAANGQTVWSATYSTFGRADVEVALIRNNLRFPGQYYDAETDLHYNFYRHYDPGTGRYLQLDLVRNISNAYSYANNNPLSFIDPLGLCPSEPPAPGIYDAQGWAGPVLTGAGGNLLTAGAIGTGTFGMLAAGAIFTLNEAAALPHHAREWAEKKVKGLEGLLDNLHMYNIYGSF